MPSRHVITDRIELCLKRKRVEICLRILMTLDMFKLHLTDNPSSILDGNHAVSIVWVFALGDHIANENSIGDCARILSMNVLKLHRISIEWKDASSSK